EQFLGAQFGIVGIGQRRQRLRIDATLVLRERGGGADDGCGCEEEGENRAEIHEGTLYRASVAQNCAIGIRCAYRNRLIPGIPESAAMRRGGLYNAWQRQIVSVACGGAVRIGPAARATKYLDRDFEPTQMLPVRATVTRIAD